MKKEVAVLGVGMHPWGKWPEKRFIEFGLTAVRNALQDANLGWEDIQYVAAGETIYSGMPGLLAGCAFMEEMGMTGIPVMNSWNACASGAFAMDAARARILAGLCDVALCIGMDSAPKGFFPPPPYSDPKDMEILRFKMGATNPSYFAMYAMRRMQNYGTTEKDLAMVKVKNSRHGLHNPNARFRKEFTVEEVLGSPMVSSPLRLYELCATSDGAAAIILCSMEYARKVTTHPIQIAAISTVSPRYPDDTINLPRISTDCTLNRLPELNFQRNVPRKAYEEAGIGPEDLDLAEVYDLTSAYELDWYEYINICKPGEAERLLRNEDTTVGGRIPVNPSGGLSCFGEAVPAQAIAQVCELVWQLRGVAGQRQVKGAQVGLTINMGLMGNASSVIVKR